MIRRVRWLKYGLLTLATLLGVVLLAAGFVLGTQTGAELVFRHVPGLEVSDFRGRLLDRWQASRLRYSWDGGYVELEQPAMVWSMGCLWDGRFCLDRLAVTQVAVETGPDSAPEPDEPRQGAPRLPPIPLPFPLRLDDVRVDRLTIDETTYAENIQLAATAAGTRVTISTLSATRDDMRLDLSGQLRMAFGWPIDASARFEMPDPEGEPWVMTLVAKGPLTGELEATLNAEGYVSGQVKGQVKPLHPGLPVDLTARIDRYPTPGVPETLVPRGVQLTGKGDLDKGWVITGQGRLDLSDRKLPVNLNGWTNIDQARVDKLTVGPNPQQRLTASGAVSWQDRLSVLAQVNSRGLPWKALVPGLEDLPLDMEALEANVTLLDDDYQGQVLAEGAGPTGPLSLKTPFEGDFESLVLPQMELVTDQGRAQGRLRLGFASGISWDTDLRLAGFDPGFWVEALPGELSGTVSSRGSYADERLEVAGKANLEGTLREQPVELRGEGEWDDGQWVARQLNLRMGDNRVTGEVGYEGSWRAQLEFALNRLAQLWPEVAGSLSGEADLKRLDADASGSVTLKGSDLAYGDYSVGSLSLKADRDARGALDLEAQGDRLSAGEQQLAQLGLTLRGTEADHDIGVTIDDPRLSLQTAFRGELDWPAWQGSWQRAEIAAFDQVWTLQRPTPLRVDPDEAVTLGAHCLTWRTSHLCGEKQRLYPQPELTYRLQAFPGSVLLALLSPALEWDGGIDGDLQISMTDAGPRGDLQLRSENGTVRVLRVGGTEDDEENEEEASAEGEETERWISYPYQLFSVGLDLKPERALLDVTLEGQRLGRFALSADIDPSATPQPLNGRFQLQGFNLALLGPFMPFQVFRGEVSGSGELSGVLTRPSVKGTVALTQGQLSDPALPIEFRQLSLNGRFDEQSLALSGEWKSGAQGRGSLDGRVSWPEGIEARFDVKGEAVPARVEPYAQVELDPDLVVTWRQQTLKVSGVLAVPRGNVTIEELPPQAVRVSDDTVMADEEESTVDSKLQYLLDLDIPVGSDRLDFSGFGVRGRLEGRLRITGQSNTRGELALKEGSYSFYGQKLQLRQARLLFAGPIDEPYLDIEAIRQVRDVTAGVRLSGRVDNPRTDVFSEPAMSQEQALSYLILGRSLRSEGEGNAVGEAALSLGLSTTAPMTRSIGEKVGIEDLQLETEGSGAESRVVASGYLSDRLSLRYGVGLFDTANRIALRYDLTKQLYLEAASGLASSLDLFYHVEFGDTGESAPEKPENQ